MGRSVLVVLVLSVLGGCNPQPSVHRPPARPTDKASLYGDPGLMPTREGEQARAELAVAGEIAEALRASSPLDDVRVDVELDGVPRVLVAGRTPAGTPEDELRTRILQVVDAVMGPGTGERTTIAIEPVAVPPSSEPTRSWWAVLVAVLGLGISTGILFERSRKRWRLRRRHQSF